MLRDLFAQELDALAQLVDAVDAVFDADPAVEADARQLAEDGVVVVQAAADDAVPQAAARSRRCLPRGAGLRACLRPGSDRWRAS